MTSSCVGVTSYNPTTQLYNYPATCHNNKLTDLIYDGVREVDWKQAKTIMKEGSSAINKTRWLEGNRKEDKRTGKKKVCVRKVESALYLIQSPIG